MSRWWHSWVTSWHTRQQIVDEPHPSSLRGASNVPARPAAPERLQQCLATGQAAGRSLHSPSSPRQDGHFPAVAAEQEAAQIVLAEALHRIQLPEPRHGGDDRRYAGDRLWDSDLLLATLVELGSGDLPLLPAGDLNEAVGLDVEPSTGSRGTWGQEYFDRVRRGGLTEHVSDAWGGERATRGGLQLDRVLVNERGRMLLGPAQPVLDAVWDEPGADERLSDHRAVWVPLNHEAWGSR
jgi:endonuclease/exonuclease/phosphatase family metal-dependent hydrolase